MFLSGAGAGLGPPYSYLQVAAQLRSQVHATAPGLLVDVGFY
jgi:hypothetical protein